VGRSQARASGLQHGGMELEYASYASLRGRGVLSFVAF